QRDPRKRRVKPVADSLVQIDFGGLDDEDSEEDSDFDIGSGAADSLDDDENGDSAESDKVEEDEEERDNAVDASEAIKGNGKFKGFKDDGGNEFRGGGDMDSESEIENDDDDDDDEMEESTEDDESEENESCDEAEEDDNEDENEDAGSDKAESPEIKGLGQMWSMIDSDEDDEDYVPKKKKKKSTAQAEQKAVAATQKKPKVKTKKTKKSSSAAKPITNENGAGAAISPEEAAPQARIKVIVCCVCLSDRSGDEDEIVECDNCGISVHEGCYGISENHSTSSTVSSASTEPWFCDACRANAAPVCELCPNSGGIFKETDNGKWVHIVCALYTPGVAFGDVDRLSLVTLFEMPYSKWGARECSLCEDSRFSQTGVCINCDAGMCKAYFHVTCAQREGLLAEVTPEEVMEVADPFFAYCKLHADKMTSKIKRRNWLAIQSHVKTHKPMVADDGAEKLRFQRKLQHHRDKYSAAKLKKPPSWVPAQKMVRHLHTSPSAVRGFLKKAELMGVITQAQTVPVESQEMRKKAQGQPAFTSDFISYFMGEGFMWWWMCPLPHVPEVFKPKKRTRSPSKKDNSNHDSVVIHQCGICNKTMQQHLMAKCDSCKKHFHLGCLNPPLTRMPKKTKLFGWQCSFCALSSSDGSVKSAPNPDQPRKLRDNIKEPDKYFHLSHIQQSLDSQRKKSLLNKRSKQRRQTAEARREKRQKQLRKNSGSSSSKKSSDGSPGKVKLKTPSPPKKYPGGGSSATDIDSRPSLIKKMRTKSPRKVSERAEDVLQQMDIMCAVCNGGGCPADTIRCDECMLCYHLACLDPPVKRSPKVRGYAWHCEACDLIESSGDDGPHRRGSKGKVRHQNQPDRSKPQITLASGREGREASNSIIFDIDVSSEESDKEESDKKDRNKPQITLASGWEGREASNSIIFDIDVSSEESDK
ncbi:PHD finger protein 14, partial [Plakobranchus ocellatus]